MKQVVQEGVGMTAPHIIEQAAPAIPEPAVAHVYRDSLTGATRTSPPPGRTA